MPRLLYLDTRFTWMGDGGDTLIAVFDFDCDKGVSDNALIGRGVGENAVEPKKRGEIDCERLVRF